MHNLGQKWDRVIVLQVKSKSRVFAFKSQVKIGKSKSSLQLLASSLKQIISALCPN